MIFINPDLAMVMATVILMATDTETVTLKAKMDMAIILRQIESKDLKSFLADVEEY